MEVMYSHIPQTLGRRFLKNSSVVRSPQPSIFRDVPHNGIRFPLFLHIYFFNGLRIMCVFSFFVRFQTNALYADLGAAAGTVFGFPLAGSSGHCLAACEQLDFGLPRTAPGPVSLCPTSTSQWAETEPLHPSVVSIPSPADTASSSPPHLSTVLRTWGSSTSGHNPRRPALSYGRCFRSSFGSYAVWNEKRGQHFGPLKSENLWSTGAPLSTPSVLVGEDPVSPSLGEASRVFLLAFSCTGLC